MYTDSTTDGREARSGAYILVRRGWAGRGEVRTPAQDTPGSRALRSASGTGIMAGRGRDLQHEYGAPLLDSRTRRVYQLVETPLLGVCGTRLPRTDETGHKEADDGNQEPRQYHRHSAPLGASGRADQAPPAS